MTLDYDVVVVGCGIAGLSAAVAAAEGGAKVAVLDRASFDERGGNTRWTEAFMRMKSIDEVADDFAEHFMDNAGSHLDPEIIKEAARPYEDWSPIVKAHGFTDPEVIGRLVEDAPSTLNWLTGLGITFTDMPTYLLTQSTTRICPIGGGLALVEVLTKKAEDLGVTFHFETAARRLTQDALGTVTGLLADNAKGEKLAFTGKVILACGGYQGNAEMQARYFGERARYIRPIARGGYYNRGEGIQMALDVGAATCGDFSEYHAEPIDPRSGVSEPIVFNFPYGILVDTSGRRFIDEASHTVDFIYENVARQINKLPGGMAWLITDARLNEVPNWQRSVRSDQKPIEATSIAELAEKICLDAAALGATVTAFNAATREGTFNPLQCDGLATEGLTPPKSNWALPLASAPFKAWPVTSAVCFTFGGLRCNANAEVLNHDGRAIDNLYAAGELTGIYYKRYTGATSVLRGAVFGRIAGRLAAEGSRKAASAA
ncbi:FAD-dependent oxidoreductase [Paracoccus pantotrophus]|uniref:Putative succinate dehydrogenase/fumarate reductase flavoprotein subunit n=1 Tax=Paracoccus pantotrophus TaxID=82367 RepID=Q3S8E6_PARPN|nr:FAD-dependent oxidoreductase [Paracoccus pantotrophus]AAZ93599.1 putative succinate dehydrogenase/fumarate reductase flavoprotein subunit [Paracoccus pantotrophus]RDD96935.1 FAD-dependent oxidoreductase [Paracoccus pantotrophus]WGR66592.1 FAD-dependent oxidoreductase [Paracoccus pantotrophus]